MKMGGHFHKMTGKCQLCQSVIISTVHTQLTDNQLKMKQSKEQALRCRQQALQEERRRAKHVASSNPPANQMIIMVRVNRK